jgi:hypothetical protein
MKRPMITVLILILVSGCSGPRESGNTFDGESPQQATEVLSAAVFNQIKEYILEHGDRQTYCNRFNDNPHVAFSNMDIYLWPDIGNINCDLKKSGFNHMVLRTRKPWKYYRVQLNLEATGPDLIMQFGTKPAELKERFQEALSEIEQKKGNPTRPSTATE